METSIYLNASSDEIFLNFKFETVEQAKSVEEIEIDCSIQSDLKLKDAAVFKDLLIQLSNCFEIEKSSVTENI